MELTPVPHPRIEAGATMSDADATTDGLTYTSIARIVPMPATVFVPFLACGHVGHCSTDRSEVGEIGDRRRCGTCAQEAKR